MRKREYHGMTGTKVYMVWKTMRKRCSLKSNQYYHLYGGRGIKVCARWDKFSNFLEDMGLPPENYQIDRIDNDGNYDPGNCRWATPKENARNSSATKLNTEAVKVIKYALKYMGVHPQKLAELHGVSTGHIYAIKAGVSWSDISINNCIN